MSVTVSYKDLTKLERKRLRSGSFVAIVDGCRLLRRNDGTVVRVAA